MISIRKKDSHWEVWIDADEDEFQGVCVGVGTTKNEALRNAQTELERLSIEAFRRIH